jgi:hypothetical protein
MEDEGFHEVDRGEDQGVDQEEVDFKIVVWEGMRREKGGMKWARRFEKGRERGSEDGGRERREERKGGGRSIP